MFLKYFEKDKEKEKNTKYMNFLKGKSLKIHTLLNISFFSFSKKINL